MTRLTMAEHVHELTASHTSRARYDYDANGTRWTADHVTEHPPLITQLDGSMNASSQGGEIGTSHPGSRPTANLDALDAVADIDQQANRWITDLGERAPLDTTAAVRRLYGLSASAPTCDRSSADRSDTGIVICCTWHAIDADVRRWWIRARVLTGWDSPVWKPDATCPLCGERRSLALRWSSKLATCSSCRETWDSENIGLLADHIREESEAGRFARPVVQVPCVIDPEAGAGARMMLCPDCGSSRCVKAQEQTVGRLVNHRRRHAV